MKNFFLLLSLVSLNLFAASLNFSVSPDFRGSATAISYDNEAELPTAIQNHGKKIIAAKVAFTIPKHLDRIDYSVFTNSAKISKLFGLSSINYVNAHLSHATKAAPFGRVISLDIQNYLVRPNIDENPFEDITEKLITNDPQLAGTEDLLIVQRASNFNMLLGSGYNICKLYQRDNDILVVAYSFLDVTSTLPGLGGPLKAQLEKEITQLKNQIPVMMFK